MASLRGPSRIYCDEWVASLITPSEVKTAGKAMANHLKIAMPRSSTTFVTKGIDGQSELYFL